MKKIEYRFWDTIGNCMIDWGCALQTAFNRGDKPLLYHCFTSPNMIPMRSTGLGDMNEKTIFEGDNIEYMGKEYEVRTNDDWAGFELNRSLVTHGENKTIRLDCDVACLSLIINNKYER